MLRTGYDVRLDHGHLVDAKDPEVMEIALLDSPSGKGDLVVEDGRDAEHHAPLNLSYQRIGIHDAPTVGRDHYARHPHVAFIAHRYVGDARQVASETRKQCDPSANTGAELRGRGRRPPVGLHGNQVECTQDLC
jgi:hypothetical protein